MHICISEHIIGHKLKFNITFSCNNLIGCMINIPQGGGSGKGVDKA